MQTIQDMPTWKNGPNICRKGIIILKVRVLFLVRRPQEHLQERKQKVYPKYRVRLHVCQVEVTQELAHTMRSSNFLFYPFFSFKGPTLVKD